MPRWQDTLRYARSRRAVTVAIALATLAFVHMWWAELPVSFPARAPEGEVSLPLWVLLGLPTGAAIASGLASEMADLEAVAPRRMWLADLAYLTFALTIFAGLAVAALAAGGLLGLAPVIVRNLLVWTALGLLSARLFGRRLAWALPMVGLFPFVCFGLDGASGDWFAWALPMRPFSFTSAWAAVVLVAGGFVSLTLSAWSIRPFHPFTKAQRVKEVAANAR